MNIKAITLYEYLVEYEKVQPQKELLGDKDGWRTVREVLLQVNHVANILSSQGVKNGSWVKLRMSQNVDAVIILLALQSLGAVAVLTDPRVEIEEFLADYNNNIAIDYFIMKETDWKLTDKLREKNSLITIQINENKKNISYCTDSLKPAIVIFTSGTTGKNKAVVMCQNNLISNLLDSAPLGDYREDDVALGALPMHHVFGLALLTGAIVLRHKLYITQGTDLETVFATIEEQGITRMNGVPSLYISMMKKSHMYDLHTLRVGYIGGAPCKEDQFKMIEEKLEMTLVPVYGMSESVGISCASYMDSQETRARGVGRFYPMNTGKIVLGDGGLAVNGECGEICVKGPMQMLGYCSSEETQMVIDEEGFLHTGDLGYLDEHGVLHLTGRIKDIIIRNGVNISCQRIEEMLLKIQGITEAVVVALPDEMQGEIPAAMIISSKTEKQVLEELPKLLKKNEIPSCIYITEQIPLTSSGKPDKVRILEEIQTWRNASSSKNQYC